MQFFVQSEMMDRLLAIGGAVLFSLFIVFDTYMVFFQNLIKELSLILPFQIMVKHSAEEYIMAVVDLYLDILNLFLHILRILGRSND